MRAPTVVLLAVICSACFESLVSFPRPDAGAPQCGDGLTLCDGGCASLADDSLNCGACGQPCGVNEACAGGSCYQPTCTATPCTADQVCIEEHCRSRACAAIACPSGQACFQDSCWDSACATHSCAAGLVCLVDACVDPDCVGISCPGTLTCRDGQCLDICTVGGACIPRENPCHLGSAECTDAGRSCVDQPVNLPTGTACGDAGVCSAGVCTPCAAGSECSTATDPCHLGSITCASGAPMCQGNHGTVTTGASCGVDQICVAGSCVSCREDAGCAADNGCHQGVLHCAGTSGPTCADVGGLEPAGTSCGTDQVCTADGGCISCRPGVSCTPANECLYGTIDCATGQPRCTPGISRPAGTRCDGGTCTSGGTCTP